MVSTLSYYAYRPISIQDIRPDIAQLTLIPEEHPLPAFHAGQYVDIALNKHAAPLLSSSLAALPQADAQITLVLRYHQELPLVCELLQAAQTKKTLWISEPKGHCYLNNSSAPLLWVAGGTGIVPIATQLEKCLQEDVSRDLYLYWGVRKPADWYLMPLINEARQRLNNFHFYPVLSDKTDEWGGLRGLVHENISPAHLSLPNLSVYASGPFAMVKALKERCLSFSIPESCFFSDMMPPASEL